MGELQESDETKWNGVKRNATWQAVPRACEKFAQINMNCTLMHIKGMRRMPGHGTRLCESNGRKEQEICFSEEFIIK